MSLSASLRAPEGYHLPNAMHACQTQHPDLFLKFGGHPCAAGFGINSENLIKAKELMLSKLSIQSEELSAKTPSSDKILEHNYPPSLSQYHNKKEIIWIKEEKVNLEFLTEIDSLDPYGQDFPLPLLAFEVLSSTLQNIKWLGTEQKHCKLVTVNHLNLTFFNLKLEIKNYFLGSGEGQKMWVMAKLSQNCWNNKRTLELVVEKVFLV